MSLFTASMDSYTPMQLGEKGTVEYSWSHDCEEQILQLSFQLVRCNNNEAQKNKLKTTYGNLLRHYQNDPEKLKLLFCLAFHTRDIISGKGERSLAYDMLHEIAHAYPEIAIKFAYHMVHPLKYATNKHPLGSWKDINHLMMYDWSKTKIDPHFFVRLYNDQIERDVHSNSPSLAAKWIPRERKQSSHLFKMLAKNYYAQYIATAKTPEAQLRAATKAFTDYRKLVSGLNKRLDTVQIKQCGGEYSHINYDHVTSITMSKQKKAFLNLNKDGSQRSSNKDRVQAADNLKAFLEKKVNTGETIKGKRVSMYNFVKDALKVTDAHEIQILESQWADAGKLIGGLGKMIAMVDVSGSMTCDNNGPLYNAIGLGLRIAEKSSLGKRVLTFHNDPNWVNLENHTSLQSMVKTVESASWGGTTNFFKALQLILDCIVANNIPPSEANGMTMVILSDMQVDECCRYGLQRIYSHNHDNAGRWDDTLIGKIKTMYYDTGMKLYGVPLEPPSILFWNLRSTSGFPSLKDEKGVMMMSGFSPALLNAFCDKGVDALKKYSPWNMLCEQLCNERYTEILQP